MTIDLGALPPEVSSAMIYAGPGSGSLTTAAAAWNGLAAELNAAALGYDQVITSLAGEEWLGPASGAMAAAAQPYVDWMTTTAGIAEQTAGQHMSAAAAYETVLASVVPPPLIALNRAELAQAQATNILGQNNGIIAQLEAQYAQFWAQNASALYSYAGQSAAATKVTPVQNAPNIVNPSGTTTQAAAVTAAQATPAATIQDFLTQVQQQLGALAGPFANVGATQSAVTGITNTNPLLTEAWFLISGQTVLPSNFGTMINGYAPYASLFYNTEGLPYFSVGMGNFGVQMAKTLGMIGGAAPAAAAAVPKALPGLGGLLGGGAAGAAAHLGSATSIGKLSVPATWASAVGPGTIGHAPQLVSTVSAAPEAAGGTGNLLGGMPLAGMGTGTSGAAGPRYGFKPTVMARPPLGG
ncbi:PPE family protein [Mycobacterium sp. Marseille-P9652]|uniref:PPE family protein n=1 Tax=Mycobacterium sp. Marseille-P9652 TaxID=2654950 RepID=UPI0012E6FC61|nr:PPE family protein [Mycobacterium sp. Marseille-P9652]